MIKFLSHIDASLAQILRLPQYAELSALPIPESNNVSSLAHVVGSGVYYQAGMEWVLLSDFLQKSYKGIADPSTDPEDTFGFWITNQPGIYTHFLDVDSNPIEIENYFAFLSHDGSGWTVDQIETHPLIVPDHLDYVPSASGNTTHKNRIVTASDGTMWFIDMAGNGHRFTITPGDIEITDANKGVIHRTENGSRIRQKITNYGAIITNIL